MEKKVLNIDSRSKLESYMTLPRRTSGVDGIKIFFITDEEAK
jgi:hypothetical protein